MQRREEDHVFVGGAGQCRSRRCSIRPKIREVSSSTGLAMGSRHWRQTQRDGYNQGWRIWKMGAYNYADELRNHCRPRRRRRFCPLHHASHSDPRGGGTVANILNIDFNQFDSTRSVAPSATSPSALEFMKANSTDLSAFKNHGGELIIVHGVSDPTFSMNDTINWWTDVNRLNGGAADQFVRLFAVPGMNHCASGSATNQFDAFTALMNWVEKAMAPDRIAATAGNATPWPGRTRPLCPFPKSRYKGSGSIEDANNFLCAAP